MKNDCETFSESNFFLITSACYNSFGFEEWMKWMCSETWKKLFSIYQFVIRTTLTLIWELSFETFFPGIKVLIGPFCTSQKKFHKEPSFVLYSANMLSFAKKVILVSETRIVYKHALSRTNDQILSCYTDVKCT